MFMPLTQKETDKIVSLQFNAIKENLAKNGIDLAISKEAISWIAETGFDPQFGARPIKRVIQRSILNELSKKILSNAIDKSKIISIEVKNNEIVFIN